MKQYFSANWAMKFEGEEIPEFFSAGAPSTIEELNSLIDIKEVSQLSKDQLQNFPVREMAKFGWITANVKELREHADDYIKAFFEPLSGMQQSQLLFKRSFTTDGVIKKANPYAITAWANRVLLKSNEVEDVGEYNEGIVDLNFMKAVARLSSENHGPLLARDFLKEHGILLIVERHLSKTYLDGVVFLNEQETPVIGMSIRYDRQDSFWFTLLHELAHVSKHIHSSADSFFDDLDNKDTKDLREIEADLLAKEALIPRSIWARSNARKQPTAKTIMELAEELDISPSIIVGRLRRELGDYSKFGNLLGEGTVRNQFQDVYWE